MSAYMHAMFMAPGGYVGASVLTHGHTGCICRCMDLATEAMPLAKGQGPRVKNQGAFGEGSRVKGQGPSEIKAQESRVKNQVKLRLKGQGSRTKWLWQVRGKGCAGVGQIILRKLP